MAKRRLDPPSQFKADVKALGFHAFGTDHNLSMSPVTYEAVYFIGDAAHAKYLAWAPGQRKHTILSLHQVRVQGKPIKYEVREGDKTTVVADWKDGYQTVLDRLAVLRSARV